MRNYGVYSLGVVWGIELLLTKRQLLTMIAGSYVAAAGINTQRVATPTSALNPELFTGGTSGSLTVGVLAHGSLAGLAELVEIIQMIVVEDNLLFIIRKLSTWYWEHYRAYELNACPTKKVELVDPNQLADPYPLADYTFGGKRLITLKRYIKV